MILVYDGPIIWMLLIAIILYFGYKKEQKENKKIDDKIAIIDERIKEFDKLGEMLNKGETIIKKSNFKYLKDKDFTGYVGVKFV